MSIVKRVFVPLIVGVAIMVSGAARAAVKVDISKIPALTVNIENGAGFADVYFLYAILEDLQAGLGADYIATAYDPYTQISLNAYIQVALPEYYPELKKLMDDCATAVWDLEEIRKNGNFVPVTVHVIAHEIKKRVPEFLNPLVEPIVTDVEDELLKHPHAAAFQGGARGAGG